MNYFPGGGTHSEEQLRADREVGPALLLLCPRPPSTGQTRHQVCRLYLGKISNTISVVFNYYSLDYINKPFMRNVINF